MSEKEKKIMETIAMVVKGASAPIKGLPAGVGRGRRLRSVRPGAAGKGGGAARRVSRAAWKGALSIISTDEVNVLCKAKS